MGLQRLLASQISAREAATRQEDLALLQRQVKRCGPRTGPQGRKVERLSWIPPGEKRYRWVLGKGHDIAG